MPNNPSKKGYGDGYSGKSSNNTDRIDGVIERGATILTDIIIPGSNSLQEADKAAKEYDDAYAAGEAERKSGK
jgi:hypothetical protein